MAADKYSKLKEGGAAAPIYISLTADEQILLWAPVVMVIDPSITNGFPRVEPIAIANSPGVVGVSVGGTGPIESGIASAAAGDVCQVQIFGVTKVRVDGTFDNIAIGDNLTTHAADETAQKAAAYPGTYSAANVARYVFAKAMQASTVDGDIILAILTGGSQ